ncbi:uncharacterized protein [Mytilus edulis]|uniref:uncharacterized protein n=1 Tax=Mytilus edulis TaxID=6550 RepID=UPI0039F03377
MGTGFFIFIMFFSFIFVLQIVGFFSPNWDIQCVKNYTSTIANSNNKTCFYQGLFYGCSDSGKCRGTDIIDSRVFGLELAIILGNIIVLVLLILVLAHVYEESKKSMKQGAMFLFAITEIMNIASTIIVWTEGYTMGWSCWASSWSAAILIGIIALTCLCFCMSLYGDDEDDSHKRYFIYYYVVEVD